MDWSFIDPDLDLWGLGIIQTEEEESCSKVRFMPPIYKQRYERVLEILEENGNQIKKVVDFGCAECKFLSRARFRLPETRTLIGVDLDGELLEKGGKNKMRDLSWGNGELYFLDKRPGPLNVQLYKGDVSCFDSRLANCDAVLLIELIEHLNPDTLAALPDVIFGKIRPLIVIISTPNAEFNVFFDMEERQFRHPDHKFEWTRAEFQEWAKSILRQYPDYEVRFDGVGSHPKETQVGHCSQIAVFTCKKKMENFESDTKPYELLLDITYPFDEFGTREDRISDNCHEICTNLLEENDGKMLQVEHDGRTGAGIPLQSIYERLDQSLLQYCNSHWDLGVMLVHKGWYWNPYPNGFGKSSDENVKKGGYILYYTDLDLSDSEL